MNRVRPTNLYLLLSIVLAALVVWALWQWGPELWLLLNDAQALETAVAGLGIWGPLALIAINALQIVVAPIPGYVVQLAAGYLFGPFWGGFYAVCGMMVGSMLSMWIARTFGRPFALWMVGQERLTHWETVTHSTSTLLWFLLLLGPIGDIPYVLAGLSSVSYRKIFLLTFFVRVPSVILSTSIGGGAVPISWLIGLVVIAVFFGAIAFYHRTRLSNWYERMVKARAASPEQTTVMTDSVVAPIVDKSGV